MMFKYLFGHESDGYDEANLKTVPDSEASNKQATDLSLRNIYHGWARRRILQKAHIFRHFNPLAFRAV